MSEEQSSQKPQAGPENLVAAAQNPEQHLRDAHHLTVQLQGKLGPTGKGVWALVREEKGKVKTLLVHEGTHLEAVTRFFRYIHPGGIPAPAAPSRRPMGAPTRSRPPMRRSPR